MRPPGDGDPGRLVEAMRYSLLAPGKRIRPLLAMAAAETVGPLDDDVRLACASVELIHCYSLIHDDLPAMDDDDFRRGRPSNHKAFGEATAILAGDALLTLAFDWIAEAGEHAGEAGRYLRAARALAHGAGVRGMVRGQARDLGEPPPTTLDALEVLHAEKTAALFEAALKVGALAAGATPEAVTALARYGTAYGIAFQHADDRDDAEHGQHAAAARARLRGADRRGLRRGRAVRPRRRAPGRICTRAFALTARPARRSDFAAVVIPSLTRGMASDERTQIFEPQASPTGGVKRDRAYLVVLAGASVGEMYKVDGDKTIIGRGQKAQVRLLDDGISREHAQLVVEGSKIFLQDLGSTNGTFCNGLKVDRRELADGDKILVGSTTILKFTYHDNLDEIFQKQMYESALRDGLTKAFNKKYFTDRLESELTFALRHESPLVLVMFDIDHFKKVNDTHGHQAGDLVLSEIATLLTGALRAEDVFARYGGEEFAVICRGTDLTQAQIVGERMRKAVEKHRFVVRGDAHPGHHQRRHRRPARPGGQGRHRPGLPRRQGPLPVEARRPQPRHHPPGMRPADLCRLERESPAAPAARGRGSLPTVAMSAAASR